MKPILSYSWFSGILSAIQDISLSSYLKNSLVIIGGQLWEGNWQPQVDRVAKWWCVGLLTWKQQAKAAWIHFIFCWETQEIYEYVSRHCNVTEILLKAV